MDAKGIRPDMPDKDGWTPLWWASVGCSNMDLVKWLVERTDQHLSDPFSRMNADASVSLEWCKEDCNPASKRRQVSLKCVPFLEAVRDANKMANLLKSRNVYADWNIV